MIRLFIVLMLVNVALHADTQKTAKSSSRQIDYFDPAGYVFSSKKVSLTARKLFAELRQTSGRKPAWMQIVRILLKEGYPVQANAMADMALKRYPSDLDIALLKSIALRKMPEKHYLQQSIDMLVVLKRKLPREPKIRVHLGYGFQKLGDIARAEKYFLRALKMKPGKITELSARMGLMSIYHKTGDQVRYKLHADKVARMAPKLEELVYISNTRNVVYHKPVNHNANNLTHDERIEHSLKAINNYTKQNGKKVTETETDTESNAEFEGD